LSRLIDVSIVAGATLVPLLTGQPARADAVHSRLSAVPFTDVKMTDAFWAPRIEANRTTTLPYCFDYCESTQRIGNFEIAAGLREGKFEGIYFNDSDVYKVIEGAAYTLAQHDDAALDQYLDGLIAKIAAAQQPDGYLNTYFTLVEPDKRWTNLPVMHELYCAGHLFEAAVAHYRATGKRSLLDVAIKVADHIDRTFGDDALVGVPGHEEIELALVKLYGVTDEPRYLDLAKWFIDRKGRAGTDYNQDHLPVREQSEIVGHAVRAMYLYCAVADIAARTGDEALIATMDRIWSDVVLRKMYVTGGIGPSSHNEGFTVAYDLPNGSAYAETCAAIGMALWNHRLMLLHADARYADVLERAMYNGLLSGVSLDGSKFFYVNPLESAGGHHRQPWFGCACCPTNVVRVIPQVSGFQYAVGEDGIFVALYAQSDASLFTPFGKIRLAQETGYPWSGHVRITVQPERPAEFAMNLRVPGWCEDARLKVDGDSVGATPGDNGFVAVRRTWEAGDTIELDMPMEIRRVTAHPSVAADVGRVAVERGPIVYCAEAVDNDGSVLDLALPPDADLEAKSRPELLGGVVSIHGKALRAVAREWSGRLYQDRPADEAAEITLVPYFAWDNREAGEMAVWFPETTALARTKVPPTLAQRAKLTASYVNPADSVGAVNDGVSPSSSDDHSVPRFTWWDRQGTEEWVELAFGEPQQVARVEVYWFDDEPSGGGCRVPAEWQLLYRDGQDWKPVARADGFRVAKDCYNATQFAPVRTTALRIAARLQQGMSGGILEVRVPQAP